LFGALRAQFGVLCPARAPTACDDPARDTSRARAAESRRARAAFMKPGLRACLALVLLATQARGAEQVVEFGSFGAVHVYSESPHPANVVLFVSGDGGWNQGVVDMAHDLTTMDALVAGIDITHYSKALDASADKCSYLAADVEALSEFIQKRYDYPRYQKPVQVGYSSGATLVYAALAQAPATTFKGAISLGFCPDLSLHKPLCRSGGLEFKPGPHGKGFLLEPA